MIIASRHNPDIKFETCDICQMWTRGIEPHKCETPDQAARRTAPTTAKRQRREPRHRKEPEPDTATLAARKLTEELLAGI